MDSALCCGRPNGWLMVSGWVTSIDVHCSAFSCPTHRPLAPKWLRKVPTVSTIHAPQGDRQAPAVDEGVFSRTQGSSASQGVSRALAAGTNHAPPREALLSPVLPPLVRGELALVGSFCFASCNRHGPSLLSVSRLSSVTAPAPAITYAAPSPAIEVVAQAR